MDIETIPNQNKMRILGGFILAIAITEIALTIVIGFGYWGPIFLAITGLLAAQSGKRTVVLGGSIFGVIAIILMIAVAVINADFAVSLNVFTACSALTNNATITTAPLNQPYTSLEDAYGVKFYGDVSSYDDAGDCQIEDYKSTIECYCTDHDGRCTSINTEKSCNIILTSSYLDLVTASYIIAIISILSTCIYTILSCIVICCPYETSYRSPNVVQGEIAIPTTATVQPTIISSSHHDYAGVAMVSVNITDHNDDFNQDGDDMKIITAEAVTPYDDRDSPRY